MKRLLLLAAFMLSLAATAQTYPKYTNETGSSKPASKPAKASKPEEKPKDVKKKQAGRIEMVMVDAVDENSGDFQKLMNRAVEQSKVKNFNAAISLYTQALSVANEEQAWRALVSRATTYTVMDKPNPDKAIADLTNIIDTRKTPQKQLAYIYTSRARLLYDKGDTEAACADVQKARELGLPEALIVGVEGCK
ncbi:hypothetical protein OGH69_07385 [Flavobacterium sp. MFBS3-15]|uniref:hypothetical protein n=1 Tax=Flavobacterium sp. MFBS3-15 TaxID=2989816 RepID=UPI0022369A2B|nr:hypothetical protein [Flavobacterium sp. MFBS3-15]MCW4468778.1 hypothetical protein [Flavobacterium sp. MFBS3-15]